MTIDWKNIREETPLEGVRIIGKDTCNSNGLDKSVFLGYWNEEENCMTQFLDPSIGMKYTFILWDYVEELDSDK